MAERDRRDLEPLERLFDLFISLHRQAGISTEPLERPTISDERALYDIFDVQCFGDYQQAEATIRELFTAAGGRLRGGSVHKRWNALVAWYEAGKPEVLENARRGA